MHVPPHLLPYVQGGGDGNRETNAIPSLPEFTRTLATNKYSIRQNPCWTHIAVVVNSLQIPLLSTNAQEQAFNSLGGEQSTAHCSCRWNVECNNVSLWRVSHLQTLNVFCVFTCMLFWHYTAKIIYSVILCIYNTTVSRQEIAKVLMNIFGIGVDCRFVLMNLSLKRISAGCYQESHPTQHDWTATVNEIKWFKSVNHGVYSETDTTTWDCWHVLSLYKLCTSGSGLFISLFLTDPLKLGKNRIHCEARLRQWKTLVLYGVPGFHPTHLEGHVFVCNSNYYFCHLLFC